MRTFQVIPEIKYLISTFQRETACFDSFQNIYENCQFLREGERRAEKEKGQRFHCFVARLFDKKFSIIRLLLTSQNGRC